MRRDVNFVKIAPRSPFSLDGSSLASPFFPHFPLSFPLTPKFPRSMQPAHFRSTSLVNADDAPDAFAPNVRFPNASRFAPIFAGFETPPAETPNPDAAFFSAFAPRLADSARRLTTPAADVFFERCGFATPDELARSLADAAPLPSQALLFAAARDARFLFAAPISTLRLLFDAALGFDVAALCANKTLYNNFNADARQPLTPFEEEAFAPEFPRFASLSPLAVAAPDASSSSVDAWRPVSSLLPPSRAAFALDAPLLYWERRSIRLAEQVFPWTVVFSTRFLASLIDAAPCRDAARPTNSPRSPYSDASPQSSKTSRTSASHSSPRLADSPRPTFDARSFPCDEPRFSSAENSPSYLDAGSKTAFDLSIVVEQGQMPAESWRRLKPGDLLTTNVPANALFLGLLDGAPRFLCRPGLFRGAAAVQIKGEAGDDRE